MSLFASCLAIDVRRQAKRHVDVACCVARAPASVSVVPQHTGLQRLMRKYYAPAITRNRKVHVCVLASFLALAVVCGIGVTKVKEGLPLMDLAPNGHYARQFLLTADRCARVGTDGLATPPLAHTVTWCPWSWSRQVLGRQSVL